MDQSLDVIIQQHPFIRQVIADKVRGLVIGSALGDAIGLYTEFLNKPMIQQAYPEGKFSLTGAITRFCNDSHRNKFFEGSWTDDTDQSLLIVLSYLHVDGRQISSYEFAARLKLWIEQGLRCLDRLPLGLGQMVGSVVSRDSYLKDPKAAAMQAWLNSNFHSAPNGSLMRTHPLGILCLGKSQAETFEIANDFSQITHVDPRCVVSCCIATEILRCLILGRCQHESDIDNVVEKAVTYVEESPGIDRHLTSPNGHSPPPFDRKELYRHTQAIAYEDLELDDLRKQGYVYKCLGSAILCLRLAIRTTSAQTDDDSTKRASANAYLSRHKVFEDLITELILQGGDADTNATVAGAFLGAFLGFNCLPAHWYEGVKDIDWLMTKTNALIQSLHIDESALGHKYVGSEDPDTRMDGGKGILDKEQLQQREMAFMEMYLTKTGYGKAQSHKQGGLTGGQAPKKTWKSMFG